MELLRKLKVFWDVPVFRYVFSDASKEAIGVDVNTEKTKCMVMTQRSDYRVKNLKIKRSNGCFDGVKLFTYLGTTVTDQESIRDEIKSRLKSGNLLFGSEFFVFQSAIKKYKL